MHMLAVIGSARTRRFLAAIASAWGMRVTFCPGLDEMPSVASGFDFAVVDAVLSGRLPAGRLPIIWLGQPAAPAAPVVDALPLPLDPGKLGQAIARLLARAKSAGAPTPGNLQKPKLAGRLPLRILAADDIATNREMVRQILVHLGYKPEIVKNGAEVLSALARQPFDLLLLDVQMPVMDGLAAAREIVRLHPDAAKRPKVVALTANALPEDRETCLAAGMDDYLSKPVLPADLEACFLRHFGPAAPGGRAHSPASTPGVTAESPWIDTAHLATVFPAADALQAAEAMRQMLAVVTDDYRDIAPRLSEACAQKDSAGLADLAHGLKGCFRMLGWVRIADRCTEVLGQARRREFSDWDSFPEELQRLFTSSAAALTRHIDSLAPTGCEGGRTSSIADGRNG
jgi:CheY-like chemotaxis protein